MKTPFEKMREKLYHIRRNQPKVTLEQAQAQTDRIMKIGPRAHKNLRKVG